MRISRIGAGPPDHPHDKVEWYWDHFSHNGEMTLEDFMHGSKVENDKTPDGELREMFNKLDTDQNGVVSRDEFEVMKHNGGDGGNSGPSWEHYWKNYSSGGPPSMS